ncbi:MAG: putative DNA binding domain-containing protein [Coriobacteriia bacterium]|nr:putative DNA binding domain-containing protein [Coriobacteriia bacterium]
MLDATIEQLQSVLAQLRAERSDNQSYEVKTAAGGMPQSIRETISAFANTPGGGVIIFGVDESSSFGVVGVYDAKVCQQTLANIARKELSAPITIRTTVLTLNSRQVVWSEVNELDKSLKPVSIKNTGKSYIRLYDGDYELSEQEEQMFRANRGPSNFDEGVLPGSDAADLDAQLTRSYLANRRAHSAALAKLEDDEILFRTGVTDREGALTVAGAVALGKYPQQFLPNYSIKVSVRKKDHADNVRAVNVNSLDGPIPTILEEALKWVAANTNELTLNAENGHVYTTREYPLASVRELISNALIHRDMNPLSMFQTISLIIEDERMVISNPGGLYGLSVKELGRTGSKTRNARIAEICQYVVADDGQNVLEKLGSDIPKVLEELSLFKMSPPLFIDGGIYFTVILKSAECPVPVTAEKGQKPVGNQEVILSSLASGALSKSDLEIATGLSVSKVRYALTKLIAQGQVQKIGNKTSAATKYALL